MKLLTFINFYFITDNSDWTTQPLFFLLFQSLTRCDYYLLTTIVGTQLKSDHFSPCQINSRYVPGFISLFWKVFIESNRMFVFGRFKQFEEKIYVTDFFSTQFERKTICILTINCYFIDSIVCMKYYFTKFENLLVRGYYSTI